MQPEPNLHPILMVMFAMVVIGISVVLAFVLKERYEDAKWKAAQRVEEKRLQRQQETWRQEQQKQHEQNEREQQKQQQAAHIKHERMTAEREQATKEEESVFLPRLDESLRLLAKTGTFTLIISCLEAGNQCYSQENLKRLFSNHRPSILQTAMMQIRTTKDAKAVKAEIRKMLALMRLANEVTPLLLDIDRDILLQSPSQVATNDSNSRMQSFIEKKNKIVEAIQQTSIDATDKDRIIEEIESMCSELLAGFDRNQDLSNSPV